MLEIIISSQLRIIPTRVGTSINEVLNKNTSEDHPHACGDKQVMTRWQKLETGSSPRVWGQVILVTALVSIYRIIPTRVGTSSKYFLYLPYIGDHPHACGDKQSFL